MSFLKFKRTRSPPGKPGSSSDKQGSRYPPHSTWETSPTSSSPSATVCPIIDIQVPLHGVVFLNPPEDALIHAQTYGGVPVYDHLLHGVLQITFTDRTPSVRMRCRRITIGFRAIAKLNLGPSRLSEEDVIFERKVVIEAAEGITLEKIQRFDFTLILPSTVAGKDWYNHGTYNRGEIIDSLYAEIEGVPVTITKARSRSLSPLSSQPGSRSSPSAQQISHLDSFSSMDSDVHLPRPPEYEAEQTGTPQSDAVQWLEGTHTAERVVRIQRNPDPSGGPNTLDERASGMTTGLGQYDLRIFSDLWTISCLLKASIAITDIQPSTTIFCFRVYLSQTHIITSPRDGKESTVNRRFLIVEEGVRPGEAHLFPGREYPALYRGKAAGGEGMEDTDGVVVIESLGRLSESDLHVRMSTLAGVETPIRVSHMLEAQIFFSVHGLDARDKPVFKNGPGELRIMRIQFRVMLPACTIIPSLLHLPDYDHPEEVQYHSHLNDKWKICACNFSMEEMEMRMRDVERQKEENERATERAVVAKEDAEKGRDWRGEGSHRL